MQAKAWAGDFGTAYTDRNALTLDELNQLYKSRYGLNRVEMNHEFIGKLNRDIRILEVGSNIGNQLSLLQNMGFRNLYGIDVLPYAVELSKKKTANINIILGSAFDIPFKDEYFDLVFTSGLLIHIPPDEVVNVMDEIYWSSSKYIWGFEYYAPQYTEINYRGQNEMLWKNDYSGMFQKRFGMKLIKEERYKYMDSDNVDSMFLLEKICP